MKRKRQASEYLERRRRAADGGRAGKRSGAAAAKARGWIYYHVAVRPKRPRLRVEPRSVLHKLPRNIRGLSPTNSLIFFLSRHFSSVVCPIAPPSRPASGIWRPSCLASPATCSGLPSPTTSTPPSSSACRRTSACPPPVSSPVPMTGPPPAAPTATSTVPAPTLALTSLRCGRRCVCLCLLRVARSCWTACEGASVHELRYGSFFLSARV